MQKTREMQILSPVREDRSWRKWLPTQYSAWTIPWQRRLEGCKVRGVAKSRTRLSTHTLPSPRQTGGLVGGEEEQIIRQVQKPQSTGRVCLSPISWARRRGRGDAEKGRRDRWPDQKERERAPLGRDSKIGQQGAPKQLRANSVLRTEALLLDLILSTLWGTAPMLSLYHDSAPSKD